MSATLAALRKARRVSQLELALRAGISQRHLSWVETGRSRAGRETLTALLDALGASLSERNQALLAAGYAPAHAERAFDAPELGPARAALGQLLSAHEPTPALVIDGQWDLVMVNRGLHRLVELLGLDPGATLVPGFNLLRALLAPGGLRALCVNEAEVCAAVWQQASREADHLPRLRALLAELAPHLPAVRAPLGDQPVLLTQLRSARGGVLSFISAFTSFGSPLDITLASLRVEHFFPADEATRQALALTA